jgi:hypothetical protein
MREQQTRDQGGTTSKGIRPLGRAELAKATGGRIAWIDQGLCNLGRATGNDWLINHHC